MAAGFQMVRQQGASLMPYGPLASRPPAIPPNTGRFYLATDVHGGSLYLCIGSSWIPVAGAANAALTDAANTFVVGPQLIKTGADLNKGLLLRRNSATQNVNIAEIQDEAGLYLAGFNRVGNFGIGATAPVGVPLWVRVASGYNLSVVQNSLAGPEIGAYDNVDVSYVPLFLSGQPLCLNYYVCQSAGSGFVGVGFASNPQAQLHVVGYDAGTAGIVSEVIVGRHTTGTPAAGFGGGFPLQLDTNGGLNRPAAELVWSWPTASAVTDATRKGRLVLGAHDWNTSPGAPREGLRIESDGTQALVSFFGAAAVAQQANASQATINAVADVNAKAALQSIYNLLKNYFLAPATP